MTTGGEVRHLASAAVGAVVLLCHASELGKHESYLLVAVMEIDECLRKEGHGIVPIYR